MVGGTTHELFVEKMCEEFDKPKKYTNWATAPDYGFWLKSRGANRFGHRFTLHGFDNVLPAIDVLKGEDKFEYDLEYDTMIRTGVASHTFLDLFNFYVVPSYPKSSDLAYLPDRTGYYIKCGFSHFNPKTYQQTHPTLEEWDRTFESIVSEYENIEDLNLAMVEEFYALPDKGWMIERILELYNNG